MKKIINRCESETSRKGFAKLNMDVELVKTGLLTDLRFNKTCFQVASGYRDIDENILSSKWQPELIRKERFKIQHQKMDLFNIIAGYRTERYDIGS